MKAWLNSARLQTSAKDRRARPANHHRLIAHQILQDEDRDADEQNRPGKRPGVMPQRGKERKALIAQPAVGLSGLPAGRQIARIGRVFQKARQFSLTRPAWLSSASQTSLWYAAEWSG
jgi:hypothetical protein